MIPFNRTKRTTHVIVTKSDEPANDAEVRRLAAMFDGPLDGEEQPAPLVRDLEDLDALRRDGVI